MQLDTPVRNAASLRSNNLKPGTILPLSYKTAHFQGLAALSLAAFF
jgi:hypothetical protein